GLWPLEDTALYKFHPPRAGPGDHLFVLRPTVDGGVEETPLEGGGGGEDGNDPGARSLGCGLDGRLHSDDWHVGMGLAHVVEGGRGGGVAGHDHRPCAVVEEPVGDLEGEVADLLEAAGPVWGALAVGDVEEVCRWRGASYLGENREAAQTGVEHADHGNMSSTWPRLTRVASPPDGSQRENGNRDRRRVGSRQWRRPAAHGTRSAGRHVRRQPGQGARGRAGD